MIIDNTKKFLLDNKVDIKKRYGQNFLIDKNILNLIIAQAQLTKEDCVLEIGPGIGSLTEALIMKANKVLCFEIDNEMCQILNKNFGKEKSLKIINEDVLKINVQEAANNFWGEGHQCKVIANLPYYITTPIILKLLLETNINHFIFMIQKEVAQRLTAMPKNKEYGAITVIMNYFTSTRIFHIVGRNCFFPAPKVDSALIEVKRIKNDYKLKNEPNFLKFIYAIFAQKRKTLINNINAQYGLPKNFLQQELEKMGYQENVRAEELTIEEIVHIYKWLLN